MEDHFDNLDKLSVKLLKIDLSFPINNMWVMFITAYVVVFKTKFDLASHIRVVKSLQNHKDVVYLSLNLTFVLKCGLCTQFRQIYHTFYVYLFNDRKQVFFKSYFDGYKSLQLYVCQQSHSQQNKNLVFYKDRVAVASNKFNELCYASPDSCKQRYTRKLTSSLEKLIVMLLRQPSK